VTSSEQASVAAAPARGFLRGIARSDKLAVAGLVALPFVFFWDFVLGRTYLHYLDFTLQWLPWQKFVIDSVRHGQAPFWNPYLMLGFSQVGESQVGMFYPPNILTLFVGLNFRLVLLVCLHLALAGVSTYLLLRYFRLGWGPALIGAVSYGLSGYMFAQTTNYVVMQCSAYLPLLVLLLAKYLESGRAVLLGWFSLVVAVNLFISHGGTTFMMLGGVSIFFVAAAARSGRFAKHLAFYGAALVLAVVFASIQVFPTLELKPLSERGAALPLAAVTDPRFTSGLEDRLSFFFPWMLGDSRGGHPLKPGYEEIHQYAGAFVPVLAVVAVLRWKQFSERQRWFLSAIGACGLVAACLSLGGKFPLINPWVVLSRLPVFSMFRIPARWGCLVTFVVSVAAAFGVEALLAYKERTRTLVGLAAGLPIVAVLGAMLQEGAGSVLHEFAAPRPVLESPSNGFERFVVEPLSHANPVLLYALLVVPCLCLHFAHRNGRLSSSRFQGALLAMLVFDLFLTESPTNPRLNNRPFFDTDQQAKYFGGDKRYCRLATRERAASVLAGFPMNTPGYFGIFSTSGDTPLELRTYMGIERQLKREDLLDYLGACYEFDGDKIAPRSDAGPRAFLVRDIRPARSGDPLGQFLKLRGEHLRSIAYLAPDEFEAAKSKIHGSKAPPEQAVAIARFENSRVELAVRTAEPGLLVLTDMNYPGWSAKLDGRDVRLLSAQGAFRSVVVPAGSHRVVFEFHARSVYYGAAVTFLSVIAFVVLVAVRRERAAVPVA
jgi:hypothetical protein